VIVAVVVGTIAIVAITVGIGVVIDRKVGLVPRAEVLAAPRRPPAFAAGEAPATAIRAGGRQLSRLRGSQRCPTCRAAMTGDRDERIRFGERELLVLGFSCSACGARRRLYIEDPA
jgi:hypothetical protein